MKNTYSTKNVSKTLLNEILAALQTINGFGSLEVFVQNNVVTQITVRNIKKTGITKVAQINP